VHLLFYSSFTLANGRKSLWFDHRRFLPHNYPFRRSKNGLLKDQKVVLGLPLKITSEELCSRVCDYPKVTDFGTTVPIPRYKVDHHWTKKSIFWDLPYWKDNLLRHNLDVMHIEKNYFDNIFNTVMDVKGKTKDNEKAEKIKKCIVKEGTWS